MIQEWLTEVVLRLDFFFVCFFVLEAQRPAPPSQSKVIKMLKGQTKNIDREQGKTKHEAPRSVNYRATQNKNNIGTTALELY